MRVLVSSDVYCVVIIICACSWSLYVGGMVVVDSVLDELGVQRRHFANSFRVCDM